MAARGSMKLPQELCEEGMRLYRQAKKAYEQFSDTDEHHVQHRSTCIQSAYSLMAGALKNYEKASKRIPSDTDNHELERQRALTLANAAGCTEWLCSFHCHWSADPKLLELTNKKLEASTNELDKLSEECVQYTVSALRHGNNCGQPDDWIQKVSRKLSDRLVAWARSGAVSSTELVPDGDYSTFYQRVGRRMQFVQELSRSARIVKQALGAYNLQVAVLCFHEAVKYEEKLSYPMHNTDVTSDRDLSRLDTAFKLAVEAEKKLEDCRRHFEEARHTGAKSLVPEGCPEVEELEEDFNRYMCTIKGRIQQYRTNRHLYEAMYDSEVLDMEKVWDGIDMLSDAICLVKGQDIPLEAELLSNIGTVFRKTLKMSDKAHSYYQKSIQTALACHKNFSTQGWFRVARDAVAEFQKKTCDAEEKEREMEREPTLKSLETELTALKTAASKTWQDLVKHCYTQHPPKNDLSFTFDASKKMTSEDGKSVLKKAIVHYHPDKNGKYGTKWKVLCEEMVKMLNAKYEVYKG